MVTSSSNQNRQQTQFLSRIALFETLTIESLNQLARSLTKQTFEDGSYIIRQGEIGEQFYVIFKGSVRVTKTGDKGDEIDLITLREGDVFGERALIKKEPRAANVIAAGGGVECYYLNKHDFSLILGSIVEKLNSMNEFRELRSAKLFQDLSDNRLRLLVEGMDKVSSFNGQRIVCDGAHLVAIMDGQMESSTGIVFKVGSVVGDLETGADVVAGSLTTISDESVIYIFARQVLIDHIHAQKSDPPEVKALPQAQSQHRASILRRNSSISSLRGSMLNTMSNTQIGGGEEREMQEVIEKRKEIALLRASTIANYKCDQVDKMEVISALGKGTFGNVYLVRNKANGGLLALKTLSKENISTVGQFRYVKREVLALQSFHHPFVGDYYGVMLTRRKIFILMEYIPGQDLWTYLYNSGSHSSAMSNSPSSAALSTSSSSSTSASATAAAIATGIIMPPSGMGAAKFGAFGGLDVHHAGLYAAIVMLALEHVHTRGYVYRDLKPENLMFAANGYLKLVDFGFAKPLPFMTKTNTVQHRTFTLCGTPEYMAPEVVLTQGHDKSADFWNYGVLLYELLCGHTPFEGKTQQRTFEKIVHSQKFLYFPPRFDPHCKSLIRRLLHPNAALRLGALEHGFNDIKKHAFFQVHGINIAQVASQEVPMPFVPMDLEVEDLREASNPNVPEINLEEEAYSDDPVREETEAWFSQLIAEESQ